MLQLSIIAMDAIRDLTRYEEFRDAYLLHVETCIRCHRVWIDYWDRECQCQIQYWSIWLPCLEGQRYLNQLTALF